MSRRLLWAAVFQRALCHTTSLLRGTTTQGASSSTEKICIIGGGPSGLSAALRLKAKGYHDVVVFEKKAVAGGKSLDVLSPDNVTFFLGAVIAVDGGPSGEGYNKTITLLNEYGVPLENGSQDIFAFNMDTSVVLPSDLLPSNQAELDAEGERFLAFREAYIDYLLPGFTRGVPPELALPLSFYVEKLGLYSLLPRFDTLLTAFGYGSLSRLPMLYTLTAIDGPIMRLFTTNQGSLFTDYALLWQRVAEDINVKYKVTDLQTERTNVGTRITYTAGDDGERVSEACEAVIVAIPPTLPLLKGFGLDEREQAVFGIVQRIQYFSGLVHAPHISPDSLFVDLLQVSASATQPIILGEPGSEDSEEDVRVKALTPLSLLGRNASLVLPIIGEPLLTAQDIPCVFKWEYFPHFPPEHVSSEVFHDLEALQGHRRTYWTSSLRSFETQEQVIRSAYDIVDRFF